MIKYLQRQKAKKGFTIIELIVVMAILAVLMAVILPQISSQRSRINEAKSAARDFYAAVQSVVNYYAVYDGQALSDSYVGKDVIHYYKVMCGNYPFDAEYNKDNDISTLIYPDETVMYIMIHAKNSAIEDAAVVVNVLDNNSGNNNGMYKLLQLKSDDDGMNTRFGEILKSEIDNRVSFNDGYYYAKVVFEYYPKNPTTGKAAMDDGKPVDPKRNTMKVVYTAFTRKPLPEPTGSFDEYESSVLMFGKDYTLNWNGGEICGTCATWDEDASTCVGLAGTSLA